MGILRAVSDGSVTQADAGDARNSSRAEGLAIGSRSRLPPRALRGRPWLMSDQGLGSGQVDGPEWGASDNAAGNASPDVAERILGEHAEDGVSDADRDLHRPGHHHRDPGDLHQPRTGAETPVDAEDL